MFDPPDEILRDSRYWTRTYCREFLASWDDLAFEEPKKGLELAAIGLELVSRVEEQTGEDQPVLGAQALGIQGSAFRTAGNLDEAWKCFKQALDLYDQLEEPLDEADLHRRLAFYHRDRQQWEKALVCANWSAKVFLAAGEYHDYGRVLVVKATVFVESGEPQAAIPILSKALANLVYERSPDAFYSAAHNLAFALVKSPDDSPRKLLLSAIDWLCEARRASPRRGLGTKRYGYRKRTVPDAKLRYLLGLFLWRLGDRRKATSFLEEAREDLVELGMPLDVVDVTLELGEMYEEEGRWKDLERIAKEALKLLAPHPHLAQLNEVLRQWLTAIASREQIAELTAACRDLRTRQPSRPDAFAPIDEDVLRRRLLRSIETALVDCRSLDELRERLLAEGVTVHSRPPQGRRPAGVAFELRGRRFTGHELGRAYRLSSLRGRLA